MGIIEIGIGLSILVGVGYYFYLNSEAFKGDVDKAVTKITK